jgi:hypothetical protein
MFTMMTTRAAPALPALSALLITLSGQPAPAQAPGAFVQANTSGQPNVMVAQAVVVSSVHYQAKLALNCSGSLCFGQFPPAGAKHRLNLMRMTCFVQATAGSLFMSLKSIC